ncbi:MAG: tRNA (guanosine(46)-N7)-methyltransferase TrmB [Pseudomonadota bacterium]|nr:tRNA (guanosine(46)-N7)-methyltransferase TrmB [Pseudomonadota bacterium]
MTETERPRRPIRSFVRREGRLTVGQEKALEQYWPEFGIEPSTMLFDFTTIFGRVAPVVLEIGFGNGKSLLCYAISHPEQDFLGIEVHRPGVGGLLRDVADNKLQNVRVMCTDATEVLKHNIPDNSLSGLLLFFPDPWHKKRHQKRRIVSDEFIELVVQKLQPGGYLHMATDWENYAEQMLEIASACDQLDNKAGAQKFMPRPDSRPETKFEQRGQRLGHGVWDLVFLKRRS